MNHLHSNRKEKTELSMVRIKNLLQYAFFLVLLFWLLYQIYKSHQIKQGYGFDDIDNKLRNERIGRLLGRKGGLRSSKHGDEVELYGLDLVGAAERIKHVAKETAEVEDAGSNGEGNYDEEFLRNHTEEEESVDNDTDTVSDKRNYGEFLSKEGRIKKGLQENKANNASRNVSEKWGNEDEKVGMKNSSEVASLVSFGAVILKSVDDKWKVFRFNDENGIPKHESAPSRRSNIQEVGSLSEENVSRSENDSKVLEECQKLCLQNVVEKQRLSKSEQEAVHEEIKELIAVESGKETMRELLLKER